MSNPSEYPRWVVQADNLAEMDASAGDIAVRLQLSYPRVAAILELRKGLSLLNRLDLWLSYAGDPQ